MTSAKKSRKQTKPKHASQIKRLYWSKRRHLPITRDLPRQNLIEPNAFSRLLHTLLPHDYVITTSAERILYRRSTERILAVFAEAHRLARDLQQPISIRHLKLAKRLISDS
jgi:hypothetical protein